MLIFKQIPIFLFNPYFAYVYLNNYFLLFINKTHLPFWQIIIIFYILIYHFFDIFLFFDFFLFIKKEQINICSLAEIEGFEPSRPLTQP